MIGLLQRVTESTVTVEGDVVGAIDKGLLVLVGVQQHDNPKNADRLVERLLSYRVFPDNEDKMNLSLQNINGGLLLVPQFTLAADTKKGTRPGFSKAAPPDTARMLFEYMVKKAKSLHAKTESGRFGADMKVSLINDGPVTFWLEV